jgi:hypothetical protein
MINPGSLGSSFTGSTLPPVFGEAYEYWQFAENRNQHASRRADVVGLRLLPPRLKVLRGMRDLVKAVTRRYFFKQAGMGVGATALSILLHRDFRLTDISGKVVKKLLA